MISAPFRFEPFSLKQKKLLTWWLPESPFSECDIVIAEGSVRSGKTIASIDGFVTWSLATFEYENFIIAGKSMGALKRNVIQPLLKILASKNIQCSYNRSEHFIEIGTNTYFCFGANNEASQDVLQGITAAGALADEAALFPESFVEQMIARCSVEGSKIWLNLNPEGPYHYLKTDFIDKAAEKNILSLHFTLDDNLTLSEKVKERYRRLFTGLWFKRMILGLWVLAEGAIYDMWDEDVHVIDCDPPDRYAELGISIDYATASVMTFGLYGVRDDKAYLLKEYYWDAKETGRQKTDSEFADDLVKFIGPLKIRNLYVDPSAASFILELKRRGLRPRDANNSVIDGIRTTASMLTAGRFFVDRSCKDTTKEFVSYVWDDKAQARGEDKPVKSKDHAMDRNRYFLYTRFKKVKLKAAASVY